MRMDTVTERGFYAGTRSFLWLADMTHLPLDQVNFLVCEFTALVFAVLYRKLFSPHNVSAEIRHVVALAVGVGLGYFCFRYQISHLIVQATLSYIIMNTVSPRIMHWLVLFVSLLYLSSMHLLRLTYDYGGWTVDITGPMMITTQKVTSLAYNLHDGLLLKEEALTPEQRRLAVRHCPSLMEFFSYIFHFQALMCGPLIFYNDYIDYIEGKTYSRHISAGISNSEIELTPDLQDPSPNVTVARKMCVSILCALFLVTVVPHFPITHLQECAADKEMMNARRIADRIIPARCHYGVIYSEVYHKFLNETPWYSKLTYLLLATSVVRSKYYHAWLLAEAVCNASGMGFSGFTPEGQSTWDQMSNIDVVRFELSLNFRETLETWNKSTQVWLRTIAYDRAKSHKTFWTYVLSALWHGFYPGYYITFLGGAIFTLAARSIRRSIRPIFQATEKMAFFYDVLTCLTTRVALAYVVFPFILLEFYASLAVYMKLYFFGHIIALAAIFILPKVLPPPPRHNVQCNGKRTSKTIPYTRDMVLISRQKKKEL